MATTTAKQWKKGSGKNRQEITLPSGNVCLIKAPGMDAFIRQGFIPNSLMEIVMSALDANSGKKPPSKQKDEEAEALEFLEQIKSDPDKLADLFATVDAVTVECVIKPEVSPAPPSEEERDEDTLYVDEVDFDDKMFIFSVAVGGTKDLEQFREGVASNVATLEAKPRAPRATKRTTSRRTSSR